MYPVLYNLSLLKRSLSWLFDANSISYCNSRTPESLKKTSSSQTLWLQPLSRQVPTWWDILVVNVLQGNFFKICFSCLLRLTLIILFSQRMSRLPLQGLRTFLKSKNDNNNPLASSIGRRSCFSTAMVYLHVVEVWARKSRTGDINKYKSMSYYY